MSRVGRPKGENNKDIIYTIRIDDKTAKRLEVYCKRFGIGKSQAIREAIDLLVIEKEEQQGGE